MSRCALRLAAGLGALLVAAPAFAASNTCYSDGPRHVLCEGGPDGVFACVGSLVDCTARANGKAVSDVAIYDPSAKDHATFEQMKRGHELPAREIETPQK